MDDKLEEAYRLGFEEGVRHTACARGVWVKHRFKNFEAIKAYKCSVCGHIDDMRWNYCPDCGAKMEAEE